MKGYQPLSVILISCLLYIGCEKSAEPDLASPNVGTYEEASSEIVNFLGLHYPYSKKNIVDVTKESRSEVKLTVYSESYLYSAEGIIQDGDSYRITIERCKMIDDRSFSIDSKTNFRGQQELIKVTGSGIRTGNKLVITLSIVASDGVDYGGVMNLTKK